MRHQSHVFALLAVLGLVLISCNAAKRSKSKSDVTAGPTDTSPAETGPAGTDVLPTDTADEADGLLPDGCTGAACLDGCSPGTPGCEGPDACEGGGCNTDPCEPGTSYTAPDGCNLCVCPASGKKVDAVCTTKTCDYDPCAGLPCGSTCSPCPASDPACTLIPGRSCNGAGQCVAGFSKFECPGAVTCSPDAMDFPSHPRSCVVNSDCTVVYHQFDCCGSQVALGSSVAGQADFAAAEAVCRSQLGACGCDPGETYAEDGGSPGPYEAWCDQGTCLSRAHPPTTCTVSEPCSSGSMTCVPPGTSLGCGDCLAPESFAVCTSDADCDSFSACQPSSADDCACSPVYLCKPACFSDSDCGAGKACQNKRCITQLCGNDAGCPVNFECYGGYCSRRKCSSNGGCAGACVMGSCYESVGQCAYPPA